MTTESRPHAAPDATGKPDGQQEHPSEAATAKRPGDAFVNRLGDRISSQHDLPAPPPFQVPRPSAQPNVPESSDVHHLPPAALPAEQQASEEDDALEFPPPPAPESPGAAFAEYVTQTKETL